MKYIKYLKYVVRHKWYVAIACFKQGICWQGVTHDLSKFLPSEFFAYVEYFYGEKSNDKRRKQHRKPSTTDDEVFDFAWLCHLKRNRHHWQWWILPEDSGAIKILEMPSEYLSEMLCDWHGAGKAQDRKTSDYQWWTENKDKMQLGYWTEKSIEGILKDNMMEFTTNKKGIL